MKIKRKIVIVESEKGKWTHFRIIEQTQRNENFTDKGSTFWAKNGLKIESCSCPEVTSHGTFFVRGDSKSSDNTIVRADKETFQLITEAIKEYNDLYGECIELPNDLFVL